jgi:hypothetical protein
MATPNLTEIVTTTLRNRSKEFADNVTKKNALLSMLDKKGAIHRKAGGRTIVKELDYAENSTFKYYSGYEALDVSASEVLSAAEYSWRQAAVAVTISGLEQRQNSGTEAIIDLLDSRIKNAMRTMSNKISEGIYSDGTGSSGKQIDGLKAIVADSPSTGTVGGINAANFDFWRNYASSAATSAGNILTRMNLAINTITRGADRPDIIVGDLTLFGHFQSALQVNQRFTSSDEVDGSFVSYSYQNIPVILDDATGISETHKRMYFLNTDYLFFDVHQDAYFTPLEGIRPTNQDAMVFPIIFQGNLTCSNREQQGVITA